MINPAFAEPVVLEVFGIPKPQGSKSAIRVGARTVVIEGKGPGREAFKSWREAVSLAASDWQLAHHAELLDEPCRLTIVFRLPRPKSAPKKRVWPSGRPDLDKLTRAIGDAITGILITDDSRVCELNITKRYAADAPPGCTITLEVLD